jgi:hypothetical protein
MGKDVLGIHDIERDPWIIRRSKVSEMDGMVLRTQNMEVLGRVNTPCQGSSLLEHVKLGPIVTANIENLLTRPYTRVAREPIEILAIGLTRSTHVQVIFKHEIGLDEIVKLEVLTVTAKHDGEGVHVFLHPGRLLKIIGERLRSEIKTGNEFQSPACKASG